MFDAPYFYRRTSAIGTLVFSLFMSCTARAAMPAAPTPVNAPPAVNKVDLIAALPASVRASLNADRETGHLIKKKILATAFAVNRPA